MKRSQQIISLVIGFLAGIITGANYLIQPNFIWLIFIYLSILALVVIKSKLGLILLFGVGLIAGIYRYNLTLTKPGLDVRQFDYQKISVEGQVTGDPYWDQNRDYVFYLDHIIINHQSVDGSVKVKALIASAKEGYTVRVQGKIRPALGKAESQISFAKVELLSTKQPSLIKIKTSFEKGVEAALPQPTAAFVNGILIGARTTLPKDVQDSLNRLGLSHIVAVSGYNLTILIAFASRFLKRNWKWAALVSSLWLILGFVLITGGAASVVRAGIMATIFLVARYYGEDIDVLVCLALAAGLTTLIQPAYLLTDVGWQLSFLALTGIVLLAPKFEKLLPKKPKFIFEIVAVSLAAQLTTMPLIVYKFGLFSIVAPLTNTLVLPLIPLLMLAGFLVGLVGMINPLLAYILAKPLAYMLSQLLGLLHYLSALKWASLQLRGITLGQVLSCYVIIAILALIRRKSAKLPLQKAEADLAVVYNT